MAGTLNYKSTSRLMQGDLFQEAREYEPEEISETKVCKTCRQDLPFSSYRSHSGAGHLKGYCNDCLKHHKDVRDRLREENPYPEEGYTCPICEKTEEQLGTASGLKRRAFCLDHNHESETFRAYLCMRCNTSAGLLEEDESRVLRLYKYLRKHNDGH